MPSKWHLRGRPLALRRVPDKLLDSAEQGDLPAAREVIDRLDGRAAQTVEYSDLPVRELTDSQLEPAGRLNRASKRAYEPYEHCPGALPCPRHQYDGIGRRRF